MQIWESIKAHPFLAVGAVVFGIIMLMVMRSGGSAPVQSSAGDAQAAFAAASMHEESERYVAGLNASTSYNTNMLLAGVENKKVDAAVTISSLQQQLGIAQLAADNDRARIQAGVDVTLADYRRNENMTNRAIDFQIEQQRELTIRHLAELLSQH